MKRGALFTTILVVAAAALVAITLPPRRVRLPALADGTIPGSIHIHTTRSDGRNTPDEIAAIAARFGLKFLIFTDHGDATRGPDPPRYRSGVLCLDGVEISTSGGHYVALDMPASPYPLAGEPRDVVDDVKRLGGFGIAAHPNSPKPDLRWSDWNAPFDAVEWVNPDTSWRVYNAGGLLSRLRLLGGLVQYPFRPVETLANLMTGPEQTMAHWNALANRRPVVGMAGLDAHAKLALRAVDPGDNRYTLALPSYEASLQALSVHVTPDTPFSGDAVADAAGLMRAIRAGHLYMALDGLATPPAFELTVTNAMGTAHEGDELAVGGPVTLHVRSNAPEGFTTILWRNRQMLATESRREFTVESGANPAVYRVEIRSTDATHQVSWLFSNAVYVRESAAPSPAPVQEPPATQSAELFDGSNTGWHVEKDLPGSAMDLGVAAGPAGKALHLTYALAPGSMAGQRATFVWGAPNGRPLGDVADYRRLRISAHADKPMRVSVQLRTLDNERPLRRWRRSLYLDAVDREQTIALNDMTPAPENPTIHPRLSEVSAVLVVVDTTNTKPGTSGSVWITKMALEK